MPANKLSLVLLGLCLALGSLGGCAADQLPSWLKWAAVRKSSSPSKADTRGAPQAPPPPHVAGTVAEYCRLSGGSDLLVQGYGLVVGLGKNGCSEVPANARDYMLKVLASRGEIGSYKMGLTGASPAQVLRDLDTAVVLVAGRIPPGSPKGARFDMFVSALPQTSTRSLEGGILLPTDLHLALGGLATPGGSSRILGEARGSLFLNPFIDSAKPEEAVKLRSARVPGGGTVLHPRGVSLQLIDRDYARADAIQKRINGRFGKAGQRRLANAINQGGEIAIEIPPDQRDDYVHFLRLLTHLPVRSGPGEWEQQARKIAGAMEMPGVQHEELALVWEAMGPQILPTIQPLYLSSNAHTAYWAAVAGLRLGDDTAGDVIIRFANTVNSPLQRTAIEELGRHPGLVKATPSLRKLLDDPNELVRVSAYEALVERGDDKSVTRILVGRDPLGADAHSETQFVLDLVSSHDRPVIYATQSGVPRIALFGKDMQMARPLFFCAPEDTVTVNANNASDKVTVFRKIPRSGANSKAFRIDPYVRSLVQTLGNLPYEDAEGEIHGLGVNYSQILGVLQRLCKRGDVPARFVLQPLPGVQDLYQDVMTTGRPDMPSGT